MVDPHEGRDDRLSVNQLADWNFAPEFCPARRLLHALGLLRCVWRGGGCRQLGRRPVCFLRERIGPGWGVIISMAAIQLCEDIAQWENAVPAGGL